MNKKTNVFGGDQSNSSVIAKLRNNALQQATMSKKTKKTPAALQHDTPQGVFIPSSQSELYKTTMPSTYSRPHSPSSNKHSLLFQQPTLHTKIHPFIEEQQMNKQVFNNSTKLR